jgi:phage-related minor tail protein
MCGPVAIVYAIAAAAQVVEQRQHAKAVNEHQEKIMVRNMEIAKDSFNASSQAVNERTVQEREKAAAQLQEVNRRGMKAAGTLRAQAGGMGGGSLEAAYQDVQRQELEFRFGTERQLASSGRQAERQLEGIRAGRAGQELRGVYTPEPVPNFLIALGRIGTEAYVMNAQLNA